MIKINKREARKLFDKGKSFYMCGHKLRPEYSVFIKENARDEVLNFDILVRQFKYYNCDYERGYYPAFYAEEN